MKSFELAFDGGVNANFISSSSTGKHAYGGWSDVWAQWDKAVSTHDQLKFRDDRLVYTLNELFTQGELVCTRRKYEDMRISMWVYGVRTHEQLDCTHDQGRSVYVYAR